VSPISAFQKGMSKLDGAKEELGWLKVVFAVLAAIDASLVAWLAQAYDTASNSLLFLASLAAVVIGASIVWINRVAYRKIREVENL